MNIDELHRLASWYDGQFSELNRLYNALLEPINHNASQPDKRPVEAQLNGLAEFLARQRFDELSIEQLKTLTSLGADKYFGREGAAYIDAAVRTSNYDPATAVQRLAAAIQAIDRTRGLLAAYAEALNNLGLGGDDTEAQDGLITIRIGFQNDVSINNVTDWKDTAKEWYDIIRGLAMVCEEKPEEVKVIGAASGSIILILAGTPVFTSLLAQVSKHITSVAMDIVGVRVEMENLRQKRLLTKIMETEFKRLEKEKSDSALDTIGNLLDGKLKSGAGDVKIALNNSIEKLLKFSEKGGTVDFVSPDEVAESKEGEAEESALRASVIEARESIREYQAEREGLKLLSDGTKGANS